jgi:hypothetical protein
MVLPTPPVPLKDHCSIIYNNVLYTYQADAFQSLELKNGGTWTQLPMGVSTNGSACVQGTVNNDSAFIVVGGTTNKTTQNYNGLQHYSFAGKTWQTDNPLDSVATNRLGHGAAYLSQSSSILVYGGSQDSNNGPSSQTFLMATKSPYNVQAFSSDAPPVADPLMKPWNASHALMVGGSPTNTKIFTFGPEDGWHQLNVSLENSLKDPSKVQAALLDGSDGSKVLEIFDMSTSPNQASSLLLQNATTTSPPTKRSRSLSAHHPAKRRKRDAPVADRPAYNNTLAPPNSRSGFSLASDPKTGLVVATGGNDQVPLAMFNGTGNQWLDPNVFFGNDPTPSNAAPTPSSTSAPAAASSAAATNHGPNKSYAILGGVLGGVFGLAILLILALLLIRYCRKRREKRQREQHESSYSLDNKAEMDFADVGADFMKEAGGNFDSSHRRNRSGNHPDAATKGAERGGAASSQSKRALLHAPADSAGSGRSMWSRGTKSPDKDRTAPYISAPIIEPLEGPAGHSHAIPRTSPDPRIEPRNDTGWSRYFANNNSKDFATLAAENEQETRPATYLSNSQSQSDYTNSRATSSHPHASAEVEPLSIRASQNPFTYPPNSRVMSPTGFPRPAMGLALTHGRSQEHNDEPPTPTSFVSDIDEEDEYARHSHSDGQGSWSPVAATGERGSTNSDPRDHPDPETRGVHTSGIFRDSTRFPHPGERVKIPNFPAVPDSQRPSRRNSQTTPTSPVNDTRGLRNIASKDFARTDDVEDLSVPHAGSGPLPDNVAYGGAQVRTFPRRKEELGARGRGGPQREDMSWLNLGTNTEQNNGQLHYASS